MVRRWRGLCVLLLLAMAACKSPATPTHPPGRVPASPLVGGLTGGAGIVAQGGGNIVAQGGGNVAAGAAAGIVAQAKSNVIAHDGGTLAPDGLTGSVTAPAGIVAQGGGNVIAHDGGTLISQDGGGIVAQGGGNLAGTHLHLLGLAQQGLAGVTVTLVDVSGKALNDPTGKPLVATTDSQGRYTFASGVPASAVRIVVQLGAAGSLQAIAPKIHRRTHVDVDLVSTLAAGYILDKDVRPQANPGAALDRLSAGLDAVTRSVLASVLGAPGVALPTKLDSASVDGAVEAARKRSPALDHQLEVVKRALVVGAASAASTDGRAVSAVVAPEGLAIDGTGTVYFTDSNLIRELTPDGYVKTIAGTGQAGEADGATAVATFDTPTGLAIDAAGKLYVTDEGGGTIRVVDPAAGTVATLAGAAYGADVGDVADGQGTAATFYTPHALAFAPDGSLVVGEVYGRRLRRVSAAGGVTVLAGTLMQTDVDGEGPTGDLPGRVDGLAVTTAGDVLVANHAAREIERFDAQGKRSTYAHSDTKIPSNPSACTLDGKANLYLADFDANGSWNVARLAPDGTITNTPLNGPSASIRSITALAVAASGDVYLADPDGNTLWVLHPNGQLARAAGTGASTVAGSAGALFDSPDGLALGANAMYVADANANTIDQVAADGTVTVLAGSGQAGNADGQGAAAAFNTPGALALDGGGNLYVADSGNYAVRKITPRGLVSTLAGGRGSLDRTDGTGSAAIFGVISGLTVDAAGNVYVVDSSDSATPPGAAIRKISPAGVVTTLPVRAAALDPGQTGNPVYLAMSGSGQLAVLGSDSLVLSLVQADGSLVPLAGSKRADGSADAIDGRASAAGFGAPGCLVADGSGNLWVSDSTSADNGKLDVLREVTPDGTTSTVHLTIPGGGVLAGPMAIRGNTLAYITGKQVVKTTLP